MHLAHRVCPPLCRACLIASPNPMPTPLAEYNCFHMQDGHFVPNLTLGAPIVKSLRKHTDSFLDCHLMVSNPQQWIKVLQANS